jgi:S1-C subfamily serine protease
METIPLTSQLAEQLGVRGEQGAVVARMSRASAAYGAGIRPGDVIVAFNGTAVTDPAHFLRLLADTPVGSPATVTVERNGRRLDVKVMVEQTDRRPRRSQ